MCRCRLVPPNASARSGCVINNRKSRGRRSRLVREERRWQRKGLFRRRRRSAWIVALGVLLLIVLALAGCLLLTDDGIALLRRLSG